MTEEVILKNNFPNLIRLLMAVNVLDLKDLSAIKIHLLLKKEKELAPA